MNGVINVLKPPGMTSSDVVVYLRAKLGVRKVGHTGTLDPEAAGVLPICLGKATRISDYLMHQDKVYRCGMKLGIQTDTSDLTGKVTARTDQFPEEKQIMESMMSYLGESDQVPPMHSAIKMGGKKLYQLARQGVTLEVPPRRIRIQQIRLLSFHPPDSIQFEVSCSKGTYIRALCRDIGNDLGCGAVMSFLIRTGTGPFFIQKSSSLDEILLAMKQGYLFRLIQPMEKVLDPILPAIFLKEESYEKIRHGNSVGVEFLQRAMDGIVPGRPCRIFCGKTFMGIGYCKSSGNNEFIGMKSVLL